jgi:hypothetical protein
MKKTSLLAKVWLLPIYILFIYTWFLTGLGKLMGGQVPEGFTKRFEETFLSTFPGIPVAFYQIALMEVAAGILFVVSLAKMEFLPGRKRTFFNWAIWMSLLTFAVLGFGLRLVRDNDGAANIFFYMGATVVLAMATLLEEKLN